jgi:glutathione synthase/RimK-type ligase-like ATP-grasp enzyme
MLKLLADVALLTEGRYTAVAAGPGEWYLSNVLADDALLRAALERRGLSAMRVDWASPDVDWSRFRAAVFRTTWDYFDRFAEFQAWFGRAREQVRLINAPAIIEWNLDKHYLADLEQKGVPVVRSRFVERGSEVALHDLLVATGWDDAVIKPCVSGAARHTYRVDRRNAATLDPVVQRLLVAESLMLQPFERSVQREGEDSLMVLDGRFSHAVRKVPRQGDFRVQDDHGGTVHAHVASDEQIELAERAIDACPGRAAYGRVDMVRDGQGRLALMELELIEPELWLRRHPPAAERFADAIVRAMAE